MLLAEKRFINQEKEKNDFGYDDGIQKVSSNHQFIKKHAQKCLFNKGLLVIITGIFCLVIVNLVFQSLLVKRIHEIKTWQTKLAGLERSSAKLRIEMAGLESFERIQVAAQKDLGMRVAGPNDYLCIAAIPDGSKEQPHTYETTTYLGPKTSAGNLWAKLANWLGGIGETMAQTP